MPGHNKSNGGIPQYHPLSCSFSAAVWSAHCNTGLLSVQVFQAMHRSSAM